ncbi:hypothetical protein BY996DRAFT_4573373, partial [Phakopsora pachyrhizi]
AELSMKKFWKTVDIHQLEDGQYSVRLDSRNLKTPSGNRLLIPRSKLSLAILIAREWDQQQKILKQHSLPLTSLVSRAIDGINQNDKASLISGLISYLDTDTICFQESKPASLVKLQAKHWDPIVGLIKDRYEVDLRVNFDSIKFSPQSDSSKLKLRSIVDRFDNFKLAAFERAVHVTKSFTIALGLVEGHLTVDQASDASRVEVLSQISRWGEVEDTHDVDHHEIRMKLGSVACMLIDT